MKKRRGARRPGPRPGTRGPAPPPRAPRSASPPAHRGGAGSGESFVAELRRRGHHPSIFAPAYRGFVDTDPDVVRFPSVRPPGHPDFPLAIPVRRAFLGKLRRRRLTGVHPPSPFLMGTAGRYAARRLRLPLIFTHHTMYGEYVHYV